MAKAPRICFPPIEYYEFKKSGVRDKVRRKFKEDEPDISQEKLQEKMNWWANAYDEWEETAYKKWKEAGEHVELSDQTVNIQGEAKE